VLQKPEKGAADEENKGEKKIETEIAGKVVEVENITENEPGTTLPDAQKDIEEGEEKDSA
jgi:hypothetical protein